MSEILYVGALADDLSEVTRFFPQGVLVDKTATLDDAIKRVEKSDRPKILISCDLVDKEPEKYRRLDEITRANNGSIIINTFGRGGGKLGDGPLGVGEYVAMILSEFGIEH